MQRYLVMVFLLSLLPSCAHVISRENLDTSLTDIPFSEVRMHAGEYMDRKFIFGGVIAETLNTREGSQIEVVQSPLDRWGNVISRDISEGRFIVTTKAHLDPLIFRAGREITISGVLTGTQEKTLGGTEYTYLIFEAKEVHLRPYEISYYPYPYWWEPVYDPYPYYWYSPYRYRPFFYPY
jgi:outer membrane lipoprotein